VANSPYQPRVLVVDDQIFNIEFLRCQLEMIPSLAGHCDYVDNGIGAIEMVRKNLGTCRRLQGG